MAAAAAKKGAAKKKAPTKRASTAKAKTEVVRDSQNGVTRPKEGTTSRIVWDIADRKSKTKAGAKRAEVIEEAVEKGVNPATASTQYGRWRQYNGMVGKD